MNVLKNLHWTIKLLICVSLFPALFITLNFLIGEKTNFIQEVQNEGGIWVMCVLLISLIYYLLMHKKRTHE